MSQSLILLDQLALSVRNLTFLVALSTSFAGDRLGHLVIAFTACQMIAAVGFAVIGEPVLLAPAEWFETQARRSAEIVLLTLAVVAAVSVIVLSIPAQVGSQSMVGLALVGAVMTWTDSERALHFRIGKRVLPLVRNVLFVISLLVLWFSAARSDRLDLLLWTGVVWSFIALITSRQVPRSRVLGPNVPWGHSQAALTGMIDVGISYGVIQGTLLMCTAAFGVAFAAPLRLAQSLIGPVQMIATGIRNALTVHLARVGRRETAWWVWMISPAIAFVIVLASLGLPASWGENVIGHQWPRIKDLLLPLALQSAAASFGSIGAARLRQAGYLAYSTFLRATSGVLSISALGTALLMGVDNPGWALLALSIGPVLAAPLWARGRTGERRMEQNAV